MSILKKIFDKITSLTLFWTIGVVLLLIIGYLTVDMISMVIGEEGESWRKVGEKLHRPKHRILEPLRGSIYAADGRPVAITAPSYKLYIDFQADALRLAHNDSLKMPKDSLLITKRDHLRKRISKDLDLLAYQLDSLLGKRISINQHRKRWRESYKNKNRYCAIIPGDITYLELQTLMNRPPLGDLRDERGRLKEASLLKKLLIKEERSKRINPFGSLGLRTIGSLYSDKEGGLSKGKQGLELYYDSLLRGQTGNGIERYNARNYNLNVLQSPIPGASIHTTLDMNKQNILESIMREQLGKLKAGSGTAVLMEVKTGKILAMTNLERVTFGEYKETQNYAVSDMSEPGSTFKVASMMVALEDGIIRPSDSIDVGNGGWTVGKRLLKDHNYGRGYGKITVSEVIERSSNVGIAKIITRGYDKQPDQYVEKIRNLGFGVNLDLEIPGADQPRIRKRSDNPNKWYGTTLAWMSFGYETQIPPIYTLAFFNAIANGGKLMRPYMVNQVKSDTGEVIRNMKPIVLKEQICTPQTLQAIQEMLRKVVTHGTGRTLKSDIVAISGKSGTAQIAQGGSYSGPDGKSHQVSFCGYFPSDSPLYSSIVVIRNPSKEFAAGGGSMAGPVIKNLAERLIAMETPRDLDSIPRIAKADLVPQVSGGIKESLSLLMRQISPNYREEQSINKNDYIKIDAQGKEVKLSKPTRGVVPNVIGLSATDAVYAILSSGYTAKLNGKGRVKAQSIPAGIKDKEGTQITIHLN